VLTISLVGASSSLSSEHRAPRRSTQNPPVEGKKKNPPPGARGFEQFAGRDAADKLIKGAGTRRSDPAPPTGALIKRPESTARSPVDTLIAEAERQHAAGNYEAAVVAYQKAIELRQKSANAYDGDLRYALGKVYSDMERYEEAVAEFQTASTRRPLRREILLGATYELGNAYLDLGKYAEAVNAYEQTLKILNGEWEKSIPRFDEKYLPSPHFNMGLAHLGLGQKEQAVADFKKVIELKADFAEAYFNLGLTLWQLRRADEARATETKLRTLNAELAGKLTALFK
jgi:tetratricopeptide (TPR) repeat protein